MKTKRLFFVNILATVLIFSAFSSVYAKDEYNGFSFGIKGGGFTSFTDVKHEKYWPDSDEWTLGGGLVLNYHASPVLTLQSNFVYGSLKGLNRDQDLSFETEIVEATLGLRVSLNSLFAPNNPSNQRWNIYAHAGAGVVGYRSKLMTLSTAQVQQVYGYETNGETRSDLQKDFILPFGLGFNYKVSERFDLGFETSFRYTSTDRLDARSITHSDKDMYAFTGITMTFRLGRNTNSRDWASVPKVMYPGDVSRVESLEGRVSDLEQSQDDLKDAHQGDVDALTARMDQLAQQQSALFQQNNTLGQDIQKVSGRVEELEAEAQRARETFYSVQVMAFRELLEIEEVKKYLGINAEVEVLLVDEWYKYYSGRFETLENALLHMQRLWGQGVKDAFVVQHRDGQLLPR